MLIKICGITRTEDLLFSAKAGADMLGLNLWSLSPRSVSIEKAETILFELRNKLSEIPQIVLVFVEPKEKFLNECINRLQPDAVQIHGTWSERKNVNGIPVIRAYSLGSQEDLFSINESEFELILLDAKVEGMYGGTGKTISEELLMKVNRPYILAGGLTPTNVNAIVKQFNPYGVDTASGVEQEPGIKDFDKVKLFIENAGLL